MAQIGYPSLYQRHVGGIGSIITPSLIFSKKFTLKLSTKMNIDLSLNRSKDFELNINRSQ